MRRPILLPMALLLLFSPSARSDSHHESREQATHVSTAADGTTTTTITETITRDGHTTTSTRTVVKPGSAGRGPVEPSPPPPARPVTIAPPRAASPLGHSAAPEIAAAALSAHNAARRQQRIPELTWDAALAAHAQDWARHLCRGGKRPPTLQHRPPVASGPGENLWEGLASPDVSFTIEQAVSAWMSERKFYDPRSGTCRGGVCGHYTQVMWSRTRQLGCAAATCPAGSFRATIWVCNYAPAGNITGERPY